MKVLIPIKDNLVYSQLIFLVSNRTAYASEIATELKKAQATVQRQLMYLVKEEYLILDKHPEKKKNIKLFSVNWTKIISEFIKYMNENINYLCSENKRLKLNLDNVIKEFNEFVKKANDKKFQNNLTNNKFLKTFFKYYFLEIGRLKENWTINSTFDFLSLFGELNFIYQWGSSHNYYNIEKVFYLINQFEDGKFPEWLLNDNKPKSDKERYEKYKKIHKHSDREFNKLEGKRKEQLKKIINQNKELTELFILDKILKLIRIKPTLQLGLNNAIKETGKEIFRETLSKNQIKKYFEIMDKNNLISSIEEKNIIEKDFKELIGESTEPS